MIALRDHPRPWVAKFPIVGEGGNVYDANGEAVFSDRLDLELALWIAEAVNKQPDQHSAVAESIAEPLEKTQPDPTSALARELCHGCWKTGSDTHWANVPWHKACAEAYSAKQEGE